MPAIKQHCNSALNELLGATECQPSQLEETVNAVLRKWDTRAGELIERIINPKEIVP
jgi:hypothetical protein